MSTIFRIISILGLTFSAAFAQADLSSSQLHQEQIFNIQNSLAESTIDQNTTMMSYSYYNWGRANNGYGYCYQYASNGQVLNGGTPVSNYLYEMNKPSYYNWGRANNGYGYCYQYTANGLAMNEGKPQSNYYCEMVKPSYYYWGRANNGNTYCYQYTASGLAMNEGKPVSNYYCGGR
jgi:hypothetical protein